jgi:hypothetical protein
MAQGLLLVFTQIVHVQVAMLFEPVLVGLDCERSHQAEATLFIGKDPHDMGPAFEFFVQAFQHVGAFEMLMMLARQPVEGEGLVDILFDPAGELRIFS